jgi:hypothetical protein
VQNKANGKGEKGKEKASSKKETEERELCLEGSFVIVVKFKLIHSPLSGIHSRLYCLWY